MNANRIWVNRIHQLFIVPAILTSLLLTGCGGRTPEAVNLTINMIEYAFSPNQIELRVGQEVILTLVNLGHWNMS